MRPDLGTARTNLLVAWANHERYGLRLTRKYQKLIDQFEKECSRDENGHPIGEPRKPSIGPYEGVRESEALVAASQTYAEVVGVTWTHLCQQQQELRRQGLEKEEILARIEEDPSICYRPPAFWRERRDDEEEIVAKSVPSTQSYRLAPEETIPDPSFL